MQTRTVNVKKTKVAAEHVIANQHKPNHAEQAKGGDKLEIEFVRTGAVGRSAGDGGPLSTRRQVKTDDRVSRLVKIARQRDHIAVDQVELAARKQSKRVGDGGKADDEPNKSTVGHRSGHPTTSSATIQNGCKYDQRQTYDQHGSAFDLLHFI